MAYFLASGAYANPIRVVNAIAAVSICCLLATPASLFVLANIKGGPPTLLTLYVHEKRTPPASVLLVAPTTGPLIDVKFGSVSVFDNDVRETNATDSKYLGRQLGTVVIGIDNATFYASFTYLLSNPAYNGSLTLAGITQSGKLAVTGGTDTFSFVKGVGYAQTVSSTATAAVYEYILHLKYDV